MKIAVWGEAEARGTVGALGVLGPVGELMGERGVTAFGIAKRLEHGHLNVITVTGIRGAVAAMAEAWNQLAPSLFLCGVGDPVREDADG